MDKTVEVNFDGLVGPTHNYGDLAFGNIASMRNAQSTSYPRKAALQGLAKMRILLDLGIPQAILPPHERPHPAILRSLGFAGPTHKAMESLAKQEPQLLSQVMSASAMWTANAATISPSTDTADGKVHITPANLANKFHRSIETDFTSKVLHAIFADTDYFVLHQPLPSHRSFGDEGAANHSRLTQRKSTPGLHLFTYGVEVDVIGEDSPPAHFPRRQTKQASQAIARTHLLDSKNVFFLQQSTAAINAGAFHNDVVAVANENVLFMHEKAYANPIEKDLADRIEHLLIVPETAIPLTEAIETYLFNAQLVTLEDQSMALIAPAQVKQHAKTKRYLEWLIAAANPISQLHTVDLQQSMANGGGPACLRLRARVNEKEKVALSSNYLVDHTTVDRLENWVKKHYREHLQPLELADPTLIEETQTALDELTQLLDIGPLYSFQGRQPPS